VIPVLVLWLGLLVPRVGALTQSPVILIIQDPSSYLVSAPTVTVSDAEQQSVTVEVRDDGNPPDARASDGKYTGTILGLTKGKYTFSIQGTDRTWTGSAKIDPAGDKPTIALRLGKGGMADVRQADATDDEIRNITVADGSGRQLATVTYTGYQGMWAWFVLFAAGGVGLGLGFAWWKSAPRRPSVLRGASPSPVVPRRLRAGEVGDLLAATLPGHRLVVVGDSGGEEPRIWRVAEPHPLPGEVVVAADELARWSGPPVGILVLSPSCLDAPGDGEDPARVLAREAEGRFPIWVVDGPWDWSIWSAEGSG